MVRKDEGVARCHWKVVVTEKAVIDEKGLRLMEEKPVCHGRDAADGTSTAVIIQWWIIDLRWSTVLLRRSAELSWK